MSDTPETDAFFMREDVDWDMEYDLCRKLERERDSNQRQADALLDQLGAIQERMIDAERERDVAREVTKNLSVALTAAIRSANVRQEEAEQAMADRDEWKEVAEGSLLGAIKERDALRNELNFTIRLSRTWEDDVKNISADRDYWKLEAEQWREINK